MTDRQSRLHQVFESIVMISLDCVRPEALGCYPERFPLRVRFPRRASTPNIDHLAANGHRLDQAVTQAPFTPAAHASLLTGLIPPRHGIRTILGSRLREDVTTLAAILSAEGWRCGAVVGSGALAREFGLHQGFHFYDDDIDTRITNWLLGERRDATEVTDRALAWLQSVKRRRVFLFVHYFDAHHVGRQPADNHHAVERMLSAPGLAAMRPALRTFRSTVLDKFEIRTPRGRYDGYGRRFMLGQVANIDRQIGRLLNRLAHDGLLDKTLIVILADHGEDFMEHGEPTHRMYLYDTTLRVPLIIYPRMGSRAVVDEQVRLTDLFPTILGVLNLDRTGIQIDGASLTGLFEDAADTAADGFRRAAYAETVLESSESDQIESTMCFAALRVPPWKLIWDRLRDSFELFNLEDDPGEVRNLCQRNERLVDALARQLRHLAGDLPISRNDPEHSVLVQRLRSLGYL